MLLRLLAGVGKASGKTVPQLRERVLVVDDDPICRALLDAIFDMHGFDVFTTDTVLGASELIASFRPDVILLDLALPYRSGASWLTQLKAQPETASIPVVILSALPDMLPQDRKVLAAAIVPKPFRTRALVEVVRAVSAGSTAVVAPVRYDSASTRPLGSP